MKEKNSSINFNNSIDNFFLDKVTLKKNQKIIKSEYLKIKKKIDIKNNIFYTFSENYKLNLDIKNISKFKKFVIVGMGGSTLGAKSIYKFFEHKIKKKFLFLDNLDENKINEVNKEKQFYIFISKSGDTIETLININLLKFNINRSNSIIISERKENSLNELSKKLDIKLIEHNKYVGGRYSVFSEVGMIPAYLMGLNIKNFKKNIRDIFFKKEKIKNLINISSKVANLYLDKKINSLIIFNYSPQLNSFAYWCQQLFAESLGKKGMGMLPVISPAPQDHHSLLQLYLDGPKNKIFYILSSKSLYNLKIKKNYFKKNHNFLSNLNLEKIVDSQRKAFIKVLKEKKIPFREFHVSNFSENILGELFSYFMLETALIGSAMKVNPFTQDAVEQVKIITKKTLLKLKSQK